MQRDNALSVGLGEDIVSPFCPSPDIQALPGDWLPVAAVEDTNANLLCADNQPGASHEQDAKPAK